MSAPKFDISQPTKEQIGRLKKLFDTLDKIDNGKIEESEFIEILEKQLIPTYHVSLNFKLSYKKGDGGINFQELCTSLTKTEKIEPNKDKNTYKKLQPEVEKQELEDLKNWSFKSIQ